MSSEIKNSIKSLYKKIITLKECLDFEGKDKRLKELDYIIGNPDFWNNPIDAAKFLKEQAFLSERTNFLKSIEKELEENQILFDLATEESDINTINEVSNNLYELETKIKKLSFVLMLSGEDDNKNAIISINAGTGGTDAQDWAQILFRMYARWIERKGFKTELIDFQQGEEAGIKSVTCTVSGEFAYGYLKSESGVHRLVRISPFNANGKRHTSFASVFIYPELDNNIVIDIEEKDLRIDVFRASGHGGQHVNKTSSAVRVTHLPTGIVVSCQQEKSQHRNKDMAMKVLKSRLYQLEKSKQDAKMQDVHDSKDDISWGNQIRSYVLHPYQIVKDHRINLEIGNVGDVLDGGLDPFIEGVLLSVKQ
ncbi:MAG: peptide chain release factor 2 [Desulfobacterales bacterium]|nr:peptide chain release factor 2 [Desulfobacterales bacterium]